MSVEIIGANLGSVADKLNVEKNSKLISINQKTINDVLDYGFYSTEKNLSLLIELPSGERKSFDVTKKEFEDLGFLFETFLMDKQHTCKNKCIFCFIDQNPKGMREPIYFKDDDDRLSYLFGNYITLTNITDDEIDRIIEMKITPVNISVHTTDKQLRSFMMNNKFAGKKLEYIKKLADGGIKINCQIVLCKGVNDGEHLEKSIEDLVALYPAVESVAVVPSGITKHREGLFPLRPFCANDALEVISIIEKHAKTNREKHGVSIVYPGDEWFLLCGKDIPETNYYDELLQLENGVGMLSLLREEFMFALEDLKQQNFVLNSKQSCDIITGEAAAGFIKQLVEKAWREFPNISVTVHTVTNRFFGGNVSVSGLLTGKDIVETVLPTDIKGERVLLPKNVLRSEGDLFLDDMTPKQVEQHLGKKLVFADGGEQLLDAILGKEI